MNRTSVIVFLGTLICISAFDIKLQDDGPIVKGGTIRFEVYVSHNGEPATDSIQYEWHDNAIPHHRRKSNFTTSGTDVWEVTYNASVYPAGAYTAEVIMLKCPFLDWCHPVGSARIEFDITENLNGNLSLQQKNQSIINGFVSTKDEVVHVVELKKTDMDFIKTAPAIRTYWFVDCTYYGITSGLSFIFNYTSPEEDHLVEALVMADFNPPVPSTTVPPSTTTTSTTTPSPTTSTTTAKTTTSTTIKPTDKTSTIQPSTKAPSASKVVKRYVQTNPHMPPSNIKVWNNGSLVTYNVSVPYVCNSSYISTDSDKIYGYFFKKFSSKDPLSKVNVTGNNWIQPGDLLSLRIRCNGSKNFKYCVDYKRGEYNVTGNETCEIYQQVDKCDFSIRRYLSYPKYTIIVIIQNDVSKQITPVTVNIYEVKKQGQLSVIVVPVAFSLAAVVLIVFGIAYYFQNRSRFIIEVADFNFGQQYTDMEYKTFRERLRDSIANAFTRTPTPSSSEVPVWPPGRKYGSMT